MRAILLALAVIHWIGLHFRHTAQRKKIRPPKRSCRMIRLQMRREIRSVARMCVTWRASHPRYGYSCHAIEPSNAHAIGDRSSI